MHSRRILLLLLSILLLFSLSCSRQKSSISSDTRKTEDKIETVDEVTSSVDLASEYPALLERIENVNIVSDYVDKSTGLTIRYNIYVPESYDGSKKVPLVLFLADSALAGSNNRDYWRQGLGGVVWASDALQKESPAIILAPTFNEPVVDETTLEPIGAYAAALGGLVESFGEKYAIDEERIYATGQGAGGTALMALETQKPGLFSASMFVDCAYSVEKLKSLAKEKFCYFAYANDPGAKSCMDQMVPIWQEEGARVSSATWNAQTPLQEIDRAAKELISSGSNIYCITWEAGSIPEGSDMFDTSYRVNAMVEWVLSQRK